MAEMDDAARGAALDAWAAWADKPRAKGEADPWATEGAALWEAAYRALDFSWDGLARVEDEVDYGPVYRRTTAGALKQGELPDDFPGDSPGAPNLQDYWRTHRDFWGEEGGFTADELARIAAAGIAEAEIYDARGFASHDAMAAAGHLRNGADGARRHLVHHPDGAADAAQGVVARLIGARLAKTNRIDLAGGVVGAGLSAALKAHAPTNVKRETGEDGETVLTPEPPTLSAPWSQLSGVDWRARALGEARLESAQFHGVAGLESAQFHSDAWLQSAQFHGFAWLRSAQFHGRADLQSAQFHGRADLESAQFHGDAALESAQFHSDAWLRSAQFYGDARLHSAQFHGVAALRSAQFYGDARLHSAQFHGVAALQNAQFHRDAQLADAAFAGPISFSGARFADGFDASRARFAEVGDFRQAGFAGPLVLIGASFAKGVDLTGASFAGFENAHRRDRKRDWASEKGDDGRTVTSDQRPVPAEPNEADILFGDYETAFRKLKRAAEEERDQRTAQRMHRYEQIARRHRRFEVTAVEKAFSWLYGLVSDYGEAILRPLAWGLIYVPLVFSLVFLGLAAPNVAVAPVIELAEAAVAGAHRVLAQEHDEDAAPPAPPAPSTPPRSVDTPNEEAGGYVFDALMLGYTNAARPFLVWNAEAVRAWAGGENDGDRVRNRVVHTLLAGEDGPMGLFVRALSTLQSLFTVACLFLSALALRRRFQVD